jgi:CBS domain-containing protein
MMNEPIHTIMTKQVITLHPENTLSEVRDMLMGRRIHHIPIVEGDNQLVGMISSWDMFKLGKSAEDMANIKVHEVMTTKLATLGQDEHIGAVAELLMEHLFHAVPIVNDQHQLIGIVTSYDMLRYEYRKEYPENLEKFIPENM